MSGFLTLFRMGSFLMERIFRHQERTHPEWFSHFTQDGFFADGENFPVNPLQSSDGTY